MRSTEDVLALASLPEMTGRRLAEVLARPSLRDVLAHPREHADLLGGRACLDLATGATWRRVEAQRTRAAALGVRLIGLDDPDYPPLLRRTYDPPCVLFVRGRVIPGEGPEAVALVGSRAASPVGCTHARRMARELATAGLAVVSGLARGIDVAAHRGALDAGGRTVAVLGSGLDQIYPAEHAVDVERIVDTGLVVSEFPFGTPPRPGHFPRRNRIIAGWGRAVVVVEAALRSGALVTARCALDEGRDVYAVPGHPCAESARGTNALVRDGAPLVRDAADVLSELGWDVQPVRQAPAGERDGILAVLRPDAPLDLDQIERLSGRPAAEVLSRLTALEIETKVRRLPGALFVRA